MVDRIENNIPVSASIAASQVSKTEKKEAIAQARVGENKVLLSMLANVPRDMHAQTMQQLSNAMPKPAIPFNKSDINNAKDKIDPNISMGIFFELLQKFMIWMRKSTRTEFLEERELYQQEMQKAANDLRSAAGFTMAAGIVGGAIGIAASAVGIRGAIKAASVDKASLSEISDLEQEFKIKNLGTQEEASSLTSSETSAESQTISRSSSQTSLNRLSSIEDSQESSMDSTSLRTPEETVPKSVEAGYSVQDDSVKLNVSQPKPTLKNVKLTEEQENQIASLRQAATYRGNKIMQQTDVAKSLMTSGAQIISSSLEFGSGVQKAEQVQDESVATTVGSYAEQQTQLYAQAGESISKLQQKLSSIIESDIEARKTIIRS